MDFPLPPASLSNIQQLYNDLQTQGGPKTATLSQGQLLQGLVSAKSENNTYLITLGGKQIQAQSDLPLQVGQKLDLQVAKLTPQVELQIVSNPTTRQISGSIHLLSSQNTLLTNLTQLESQTNLTNISQQSRQTLESVAQTATTLSSITQPAKTEALTSLFQNILQSLRPDQPAVLPQSPALQNAVQNLLMPGTVASGAESSGKTPAAQLFQNFAAPATGTAGTNIPLTQLATQSTTTTPELTQLISSFPKASPQLLALANQIATFFSSQSTLAPTTELNTLLSTGLQQSSGVQEPSGQSLQQLVDRIGLDMEQLFAQGKREEAVQTLKFALLEVNQQLSTATKSGDQATQMLQTVELYQVLQVRLASEGIFFMPLPLPFLDQGYLLIDQAPEQNNQNQQEGEEATDYTLHLQLEGLGNLRIEIQHRSSSADIRFYGEDQQRISFMREHKEELAEWLTAVELGSAQFFTGAENPTRELLEKIIGDGSGMINTQA